MSNIKPLTLKTSDVPSSNKKEKNGFIDFLVINKFWLIMFAAFLLIIFSWKNSSTPSVLRYITGQGSSLQTENNRVNVLLLGMAGGKHDGATLTDTIMVASFNTQTHEVSLISLPRDLWLESEKSKINTLYQKGLARGEGLKYTEGKFSDFLGIKIPYGVRVDFSGFIKAVDLVGGIEVDVVNSFDDYLYPIEGKENDYCGLQEKDIEISEDEAKKLGIEKGMHQVLIDEEGKIATVSAKVNGKIEYTENSIGEFFPCRYEHISFTKGLTHMDGITALKYVRSRHGIGSEGSDFARSRRQQLVLQAFKEKVLSADTLTDVNKIAGLLNTFGQSVETDIPQSQYLEFAGILKKVAGVRATILSPEGKNSLLITPPAGTYGAWVLIPPNNDFSAIKNHLTDFLNKTDTATKSAIVEN
jgi:polyisoprenyl-teichoic acid--peptidoglycan teichoic acid transferase